MENHSATPSYPASRSLRRTFLKYLVICSALTLLNFYTGGPWWVLWVWGGWGVYFLLKAAGNLFPDKEYTETSANPRRAFYRHLAVYIVMIGLFALVNYLYTSSYPWVLWIVAGWGLAVVLQAVDVFSETRE